MDHSGGVREVSLPTGVSLSYLSTGPSSETPVLLLHAWGESRRIFDRLMPLLPPSVHAIAVDQRGHGDASKPSEGYALDDGAADIEAFLDALHVSSAVVVGSSSGGYVAQQLAVTCPDRVVGLVLVGSPRSLQGRPPFADEVDRLTDPVDPAWVRESLSWFPRVRDVPQWYIDDRVDDGARIPAHVWRASLHGLSAAAPPSRTGRITAPTLVLWGDGDELLRFEEQEALVAAIPGSRLIAYPGVGHLVLWESPERVASDVSEFVATGLRRRPRRSQH